MSQPLILVVDDEVVMRRVLHVSLRSQGYAIAEAATGKQALEKVVEQRPEAMILDLGLPDMDGVEVAAMVRQDHDLPIIVLSVRAEEQDQIRALDAGANDYVTKPFREGELLARVRAALRHGPRPRERLQISVGDLRLDVAERRAFLGELEVDLTPTEFRLLHVLARDVGRVLTHRHLLRSVWGPKQVDEVHYLRVYVNQLRDKIEQDPSRPKRLLTVAGIGYQLVEP